MPWTPTVTKLRDLLADLYDDDGNRRRVAAEAGLPREWIDFAGTSVVAWQNILETAQKHDRLVAMVAIARSEYGTNARLTAQLDRIAAQLAAENAPNDPMPPGSQLSFGGAPMPKVFISYVRQNSEIVEKLAEELRRAGATVWLDREEIMPGADWQYAIRKAINEGDYFIACFSAEYVDRPRTYMSTEIGLAIEMLQQMPIGRIWFIPVLLSKCEVPDLPIGGGRTLSGLHREALYKDWEGGVRRILKAMGVERLQVELARAEPAKSMPPDLLAITKLMGLELVRIPAGKFAMGTDDPKFAEAGAEEQPRHSVYLSDYFIGKFPVTNTQFEAFVKATGRQGPAHWSFDRPPIGKENHPVVHVNWYDAQDYCEWLSNITKQDFRLVSEAEWEKAARGPLGNRYPWGWEEPSKLLCNYARSGIGDTTAVGVYPKGASLYGVLDMAGNVFEWTRSSYLKSYPYDPDDGREDQTVDGIRVLRGGSFESYEAFLRCAKRSYSLTDRTVASRGTGFRVCVS